MFVDLNDSQFCFSQPSSDAFFLLLFTVLTLRFLIKSYPTIIFLFNGQIYQYSGKRTVEGIKQFVAGGYKEVTPTRMSQCVLDCAFERSFVCVLLNCSRLSQDY
jgi:hypothetical protein